MRKSGASVGVLSPAHELPEETTPEQGGRLERDKPLVPLRYYLKLVSSAFISMLPSATNPSDKAIPVLRRDNLRVSC